MRIKTLPITAWWGPAGYGGPDSTEEYQAYVAANFNMVLVSDRGPDRCSFPSGMEESWNFIRSQIKHAEEHNMTALIDTYRCLPWGNEKNTGGESQGGGSGFVLPTTNHKITLPEIQWLAQQLQHDNTVAGLLITDDGVDLCRNEIEEIEWMLDNTPELWPWVNQCGDGSEWLARTGTPYLVPELYSVKGPGGNATAMVAAQFTSYAVWQDKGNRYAMDHFPLINLGDGGDTGFVQSESLTRVQAYGALAYGAKGIMWYCWGRGAWNFTAKEPTVIYAALAETNQRMGSIAWNEALLLHDIAEGTYQTGFHVPLSSSPGPEQVVTAMDQDLLVGVMSATTTDTVLLLIVDKRVTTQQVGPEARQVQVHLNQQLVSTATAVAGGIVQVHGATITARLRGGEGVLVLLQPNQKHPNMPSERTTFSSSTSSLASVASSLRPWMYLPKNPSLYAMKTTQYDFYDWGYSHRPFPRNFFLLGGVGDATSSSADVANFGVDGFNLVSTPLNAADPAAVLNSAMRQGVFVVLEAAAGQGLLTLDQVQTTAASYSCHPNFAGWRLSFTPIDTSNSTLLQQLQEIRIAVQHDSSHMFPLISVKTPAEVLSTVVATGLPTVLLNLGAQSTSFFQTANALGTLRLKIAASSSSAQLPFLVETGSCLTEASDGVARFQAFAAAAFGAKGILHADSRQCTLNKRRIIAAEVNFVLARYGGSLLQMNVVGLISSAGYEIPGTIPSNQAVPFLPFFRSMDPDLLVSVFVDPATPQAPPALMIVDLTEKAANNTAREATVLLDFEQVASWTPVWGDSEAGFSGCTKAVLGSIVTVHLLPGQGVMVELKLYNRTSIYNPSDFPSVDELWL